jgi:hypothetical protein
MALPVFPSLPGIGFPVKRAVRWSTIKQDALSGKRARYPLWSFPVYDYELPLNFLRSDQATQEWQTLAAFVNSVQGAAQLWAYNDVNDNSVTNQGFGIGDGVSVAFQLVRSFGGFVEPIFLPAFLVNGGPLSVFVNGAPVGASVLPFGIVSFLSIPPPGASLTWTGSYYWPCRFEDDVASFEQMMSLIWEVKALKFSTEKLP